MRPSFDEMYFWNMIGFNASFIWNQSNTLA